MIMVLAVLLLIVWFFFLAVPVNSLLQVLQASSAQRGNHTNTALVSLVSSNVSDSSPKSDAGKLQTRYTGLIRSDISPNVARALNLNETFPGLIVTEVLPDSPAEKAGIRGGNMVRSVEGEIVRLGGDIIVAADGNRTSVKDREVFLDFLRNEKTFGDNLTLTTIRDGRIREVNLTITRLPDYFWYINPDEGIRIKYPSDWDTSENNLGREGIIQFLSPEENPETGLPTAVVHIIVTPSVGMTLDQLAIQAREDTPTTRVLNVIGKEVAGRQAYEKIFYDSGGNRTLKVKNTFIGVGDQIYIIGFAADVSKYDDYLPTIEEMIKSFRIDREAERS